VNQVVLQCGIRATILL